MKIFKVLHIIKWKNNTNIRKEFLVKKEEIKIKYARIPVNIEWSHDLGDEEIQCFFSFLIDFFFANLFYKIWNKNSKIFTNNFSTHTFSKIKIKGITKIKRITKTNPGKIFSKGLKLTFFFCFTSPLHYILMASRILVSWNFYL